MSKTTELSNAKRALLEKYLCGDLPQAATAGETIPRRSLRGPAPLAFGQEQLWFLAQVMPASPAFHESFPMSLNGSLDVAALEQSLNEFLKRHEIWRTSFPAIDGQPAQVMVVLQKIRLERNEHGDPSFFAQLRLPLQTVVLQKILSSSKLKV